MFTMATFRFHRVLHLTCRKTSLLRVVNVALPACGTVGRSVTSQTRQTGCTLTSSRFLLAPELLSSKTQSVRCFSSQNRDESVLKSDTFEPEREDTKSQNTSSAQEVFSAQDGSNCTQNLHSENSQVVISVSESQSDSPYGYSSVIAQNCLEDEASHVTSFDSDSAQDLSNEQHNLLTSVNSPNVPYVQTDGTSVHVTPETDDLEKLPPPRPVLPSYNLAPYVAQSEVLQKLLSLGVDLSVMEKVKEAADFVVQAEWNADIQPRLLFLRDIGVEDSQLGHVLTKNPLVLKEDIEKMQERISYLESKKFSQEGITRIVTSAPLTLLLPVTYVDKKLGFLQKNFHLTGDEVRHVATRLPKLIPWKLQRLKDLRFYMKEMLGFSDRELKAMLLSTPRVYISAYRPYMIQLQLSTDKHQLGKRFDFLHNVMGLSHKHLSAWPAVFRTRLHIIEQRHRFLLLMGRAQYDPSKENYVSLQALVSGRDRDFCFHVAKASTTQYQNFLKCL